MALPSGTYAPRDPAACVLYQIVRAHFETFRAEASGLRDGEGLPRFVDAEFRAFFAVAGSRVGSPGFGAPAAVRSGSWPFRARDAGSVPPVAGAA